MVLNGGAATIMYSGTDTLVAIDGKVYRAGNPLPKGCDPAKVSAFRHHLRTPYVQIPQLPEPDYLRSDPGEF